MRALGPADAASAGIALLAGTRRASARGPRKTLVTLFTALGIAPADVIWTRAAAEP